MTTQKWLVPFRRGKRNYEDVGTLPIALEHDRGFGGDKLYRVGIWKTDGTFRRILADGQREQAGPFYHRRDAMAFLRTVAAEYQEAR